MFPETPEPSERSYVDGGPEASASSSPRMHVRSDSEDDIEPTENSAPIWWRESSKSFRWGWVPYPIRQMVRAVVVWSKGPEPPQVQRLIPFFPHTQEFPVEAIRKYFPKIRHKAALLGFFYFSWLLSFILVLNRSASVGKIEGYGQPEPIWCGATFWSVISIRSFCSSVNCVRSMNNGCGLNGDLCRPFNNTTYSFRCPANCALTKVLNPRAVGDQEINYDQFVIGGPKENDGSSTSVAIYRADSFICQAAIHAGVVSNQDGGCGVVSLDGEQRSFVASKQNGIQSIEFDTSFPKSYSFISGLSTKCVKDLRWPLLAITMTFTAILSVCTASPLVFFVSIFPMIFFHVGLVSDPPISSPLPTLTSLIIGRFLPAALGSAIIYRYSIRTQLTGLTAHIEKTILWLGGAWFGSLNNYTFASIIPIQRLTKHDIDAQPGAKLALALIIFLLVAIFAGQVHYLRLEGRLRRYAAIYGIFALFLLICVGIPALNLRIHHYFLALLLLPGTGLQTRPSMLYQGILVGLYINGLARWGFDSILETTEHLRGGDGQLGSLLPNITVPIAIGLSNITFAWVATLPKGYDGVSVLVNDVERYRWYLGEGATQHTFFRMWEGEKEYFRFGFMSGSTSADYTQAGVWTPGGHWVEKRPGPSL